MNVTSVPGYAGRVVVLKGLEDVERFSEWAGEDGGEGKVPCLVLTHPSITPKVMVPVATAHELQMFAGALVLTRALCQGLSRQIALLSVLQPENSSPGLTTEEFEDFEPTDPGSPSPEIA
jgi:hypothetical protein